MLTAQSLQQGRFTANGHKLHPIGAEQGRQKFLGMLEGGGLVKHPGMGDQAEEAGCHHRQERQSLAPGRLNHGTLQPGKGAGMVGVIAARGGDQHVQIRGHGGGRPSAASSNAPGTQAGAARRPGLTSGADLAGAGPAPPRSGG